MARRPFGGTAAEVAEDRRGNRVPGATATLWTARSGGTQITDLQDPAGTALTGGVITADSDGVFMWLGPADGTDTAWLDGGAGSRTLTLATDLPDRVQYLEDHGGGGGGGGGAVASVNGHVGVVVLAAADVGADVAGAAATAQAAAVSTAAGDATTKAAAAQAAATAAAATDAAAKVLVEHDARIAADALKADLVGGLVPTAQLPALALTTAVPVANQAAMLALTTSQVQPGDIAVRADGAGSFILTASDPSVLGNWLRINAPTDAVLSVNGQTGTVVLSASDVGADTVAQRNAAIATALATSVSTTTFDAVGDLLVGTGNDAYSKLPKGTALQQLRVNAAGTALEYADPVAGALTPTTTKTATYTVAVGEIAMMNVPGGAAILNLPAAPADKAQVGYRAIGATTAVPLVVNRGGTTDTIGTAGATSASIPLADEVAILQYQASGTRWLAVANVKTQASLDARYTSVSLADKGAWATGTSYAKGDLVTQYGQRFTASSAHTAAAAFTTDNAAGLWTPLAAPTVRNYSRQGGPLSIRAAIAKARTGQGYCRMAAFGDSITYGVLESGGGDPTNSWPTYLRNLLGTTPGVTAVTGFVAPYDYTAGVASNWTVPAGWSSGFGGANYAAAYANGSAPSGPITVTFTGSGCTLYLGQNGSGAGTYSLDGAAAVAFTLSGSTTGKIITIAAAAGSHTLTINFTSGLVMVLGIEPILAAGVGAVSVTNFGSGGAFATNLASGTKGLVDYYVVPWDVMFLSYGINEWVNNVAPATFSTNLTADVTALKASSPTGQVVIVVEPTPGPDVHTYPWAQFVAAQYAVADAQGIPLFDPNVRWGNNATRTAAGFGAFHLEKIGYSDYAAMIYNELIA